MIDNSKALAALEARAKEHAARTAKRHAQAEAVFAAITAANPGKSFSTRTKKA